MIQKLLFLFTIVAAAIPVQASVIFGTDLPVANGAITVEACCSVAQPFSLNVSEQVTAIVLQMAGQGTGTFTLWLTDAEGPGTTSSQVLFETSLSFPNTGSGIFGTPVSAATNLFLTAGNYFLILSSNVPTNSAPDDGWLTATSILSTGAGTIGFGLDTCCVSGSSPNTAFPPGSMFAPIDQGNRVLAFQLDGAAPEPATAWFLGGGFLCLLFFRRKTAGISVSMEATALNSVPEPATTGLKGCAIAALTQRR